MESEEQKKIIESLAVCADACNDKRIPHIIAARRGKQEFCLLSGGSDQDYIMMFAALMENSEKVMRQAATALALVAQSKGMDAFRVDIDIKKKEE